MRRSLFLLAAFSPALAGAITIAIQPLDQGAGGVGGSGLTPAQMAVLASAAAGWEQLMPAYQDGITIHGVTVLASVSAFDGAGGTYAEAIVLDTTSEAGYFLATTASIKFDLADLAVLEAASQLQTIARHEMAHALGFGTLWEFNGLASAGTGRYYGPSGVAAFRAEFLPGATFVPVELGGGPATRDLHWNEIDNGTGLTGLTDSFGRDLAHDLMSGWTGPDPTRIFVSNTTLRSFEDLGFAVVPEPAPTTLATIPLCAWLLRRRREFLRSSRENSASSAETGVIPAGALLAGWPPSAYHCPTNRYGNAIHLRPSAELPPG